MRTLIVLSALTLVAAVVLTACASTENNPTRADLEFIDHLKANLIEQDVFVEKSASSSEVFRVSAAEREQFLDSPIYATAKGVKHDPRNPEAAGPYAKGKSLEMTLGRWLSARGSGSYACNGGKGTVDVTFENLVPDGIYTMWYVFIPMPPTEPPSSLLLPLGARDGSQSVFRSDAQGHVDHVVTFEPCLQLSGVQLATALAIAWHSDGKTYGSLPGSFGDKTHVHLFTRLP